MIKVVLLKIFGVVFVVLGGWGMYYYNTGSLYEEYAKLFEYRRMHPDFLPDPKMIELSNAGHTTTYADFMWINLIQYLGDNAVNGKIHNFLNPLISVITDLHPYFTSPYNLALLLSPPVNPERPTYEANKKLGIRALEIGEKGIELNCDARKRARIDSLEYGKELWENTEVSNPCKDGMLPYNIAYTAQEVGEIDKAYAYYKLASANADAPLASRFLGPLMKAKNGNHKDAAEKFFLIALDGYDEDPYVCRSTALGILSELRTKNLREIVSILRKKENLLKEPEDIKNPLANSSSNCHTSILRGMKQLYLAYIAEVALPYSDITTGEELIQAKALSSIPSIREQDGWDVIREKSGIWKYQKPR